MDLQQVYETDIKTISLSLVTASVGGILGSFLAGFLMGRFPKYKHLFTFEFVAGVAVSTMILPKLGYLWAFFLFMIFNGMHVAATHTGKMTHAISVTHKTTS